MAVRRSIGYACLVILALSASAGYFHFRDLPGKYTKYRESQSDVRSLEERNEWLRERRDHLQYQRDLLSTDSIEIEAEIRMQRHQVREGERIFRIELPEEVNQNTDDRDEQRVGQGNPTGES